jgi:flagellar motor switch protein FliG
MVKDTPEPKETALVKKSLMIPDLSKAALWLLSADEKLATEVLKHLEPNEIRQLNDACEKVSKPSTEQLDAVHAEFIEVLYQQPRHIKGRNEYLEKLAGKAFGDEEARAMLGAPEPVVEREKPDLGQADVEVLSSVLRHEHPQVMAAVLSKLPALSAAEILRRLPEEQRRDVVARVAGLTRVTKVVLEQAEAVLAAGLPTTVAGAAEVDGVRTAANVLNQIDSESAQEILDAIDGENSSLAEAIRQAMFTFEDLSNLDRRGFQTLLKEVQNEQLLVALKTASDELKDMIFDALSKRAAAMLKEDLEIMGPVRLVEVQEAQRAIVAVALQLKGDGRLAIAGSGEDFV